MPDPILISLIVARAKNGVIGVKGNLPWRLKDDLKFFKATTLGKPIIMGRKTWESLPKKPLPGRETIVMTRDWNYEAPGARVYSNLETAIEAAKAIATNTEQSEILIVGGQTVYEAALDRVTRLYISEVDAEPVGDAHFPDLDMDQFTEVSSTEHEANDANNHAFTIRVLDRN